MAEVEIGVEFSLHDGFVLGEDETDALRRDYIAELNLLQAIMHNYGISRSEAMRRPDFLIARSQTQQLENALNQNTLDYAREEIFSTEPTRLNDTNLR